MSVVASLQAPISRQLFKLAAPIIGLNVLNVLMLAVDSALCGRLPNAEDALAAVSAATQIVFLLMVALMGLIVGTVALVARAYGGGDTTRLNHLLVQSTQLTALFGIVVGITGAIAAEPMMLALGSNETVARLGADYLQPLMIGTPFFYLSMLYAGVLRGVGNTRIPFIAALVANIVNAVLNYGLVLGNLGMPSLGVTGSAIGTVVAQTINAGILVVYLRSGAIANLRLPLKVARIDKQLTVELYRVGWPAALDMLVLNASFLAAIVMLGHISQVTVAAHGLGLRVQALAFVPGLGVAQATGAMVGQALGAGNIDRAKQVARASIALCAAIMTALGVIFIFAAHAMVLIFDVTPGTPLDHYTIQWMRVLGCTMLPSAVNLALMGLLQGSGATRLSLRINFWSTILVQLPLAYILAFPLDLGALGVWLSFPANAATKGALMYIVFRQEKWAVTGVRIAPAHAPAEH